MEDWGERGKFKIYYGSINPEDVKNSLNNYIKKYDVEFEIDNINKRNEKYKDYYEIYNNSQDPLVYKMLKILIQWNYNNVFYSRRESQKNLADLCDKYDEKGADYFKYTVESYFKITDSTFVLDYLTNHPYEFKELYNLLFEEKTNRVKSKMELQSLRISLSRFLESYRYNTALNYLSGILGLLLNDYEDNTVKQRFESAFETIAQRDEKFSNYVIGETLKLGKELTKDRKEDLSQVLCNYYDNYLEIYTALEDNTSLNYILLEKISKLKKIGGIING